jgi:ribosome biogenesis protein SSF1/2
MVNSNPTFKMKLSDARRVVIFNLNPTTGTIDLRHYSINIRLAGVSKSVKSLLHTSAPLENLTSFTDIGDFILRGAFASESDVEDADSTMSLPGKSGARAIKLQELGPRMCLRLVKIQEGMCTGKVIHHELVEKTEAEVDAIEKMRKTKDDARKERRRIQEANVKAKKGLTGEEEEEEEEMEEQEEGQEYDEDDILDDDMDAGSAMESSESEGEE